MMPAVWRLLPSCSAFGSRAARLPLRSSFLPFHRGQPPLRFLHASSVLGNKVVPFNLADIGEGITECELIQWFIQPGAQIAQFDRICEVQSDKATVEITSRFDGKVKKLHYQPGDIAKVGQPLLDIEVEGEGASDQPPQPEAEAAKKTQVSSPAVPAAVAVPAVEKKHDNSLILATPAVRRVARENKVDLSLVKGTGKGDRITKEDVLNYVASGGQSKQTSAVSKVSTTAPVSSSQPTTVQLTPIQKAMVKSMRQSLEIPHFGFSDEVSMLQLKDLRHSINGYLKRQHKEDKTDLPQKLSYMPFLVKAFSLALTKYPLLNAQYVSGKPGNDGRTTAGHLVYRPDHNIGIAMDTPGGLVVPNIPRVQHKSVLDIAQDLQRLQKLAQNGQLPPDAFQNTTITMSNIGNIGGRNLSPVIPPDTVCIVAIGRSQVLPRIRDLHDGKFEVIRDEIATVSFSADHRVVDGASVARFFVDWKNTLENPGRFIMELK